MPNLSVIDGSISTWMVGARAEIGRFWICLYPHSHSNPTVLLPCFICRHFLALHWRACLWIFHRSFASFGDIGVVCFAEVKYHVA